MTCVKNSCDRRTIENKTIAGGSVRASRDVVDRFIARANIAYFEDLLARETDPEQRRVIEGLLDLERQRLKIAERQARKESPGPGKPGSGSDPSP